MASMVDDSWLMLNWWWIRVWWISWAEYSKYVHGSYGHGSVPKGEWQMLMWEEQQNSVGTMVYRQSLRGSWVRNHGPLQEISMWMWCTSVTHGLQQSHGEFTGIDHWFDGPDMFVVVLFAYQVDMRCCYQAPVAAMAAWFPSEVQVALWGNRWPWTARNHEHDRAKISCPTQTRGQPRIIW